MSDRKEEVNGIELKIVNEFQHAATHLKYFQFNAMFH
jgi:hypothetical protein